MEQNFIYREARFKENGSGFKSAFSIMQEMWGQLIQDDNVNGSSKSVWVVSCMDLSSEACILNVLENYHLTLIKDVTFLFIERYFTSGRL